MKCNFENMKTIIVMKARNATPPKIIFRKILEQKNDKWWQINENIFLLLNIVYTFN